MTIGAVASLKKGLEHFIYRDLSVFAADHTVHVFATVIHPVIMARF